MYFCFLLKLVSKHEVKKLNSIQPWSSPDSPKPQNHDWFHMRPKQLFVQFNLFLILKPALFTGNHRKSAALICLGCDLDFLSNKFFNWQFEFFFFFHANDFGTNKQLSGQCGRACLRRPLLRTYLNHTRGLKASPASPAPSAAPAWGQPSHNRSDAARLRSEWLSAQAALTS